MGCIRIEGNRIRELGAPDGDGIDLRDYYVMPGLLDIHVHGGAGCDVMDGTNEALEAISLHKLKEGVTSFCPTTVTASPEHTDAALKSIRDAHVSGAKIIGAFLEGPYINPQYKGAHPEEYIRDLSLIEIKEFLDKGVQHFAIAPEKPLALEAIRLICEKGGHVRLGHSAASYSEALAGIEAGADIAIHTYNAMSPLSHRAPGMTGTVLADDRIYAEIICDLHHVDPVAIQILVKCKTPEKVILITDCMRAGGMPDGDYTLGEMGVRVREGVARMESGALAGSTLSLLQAIKHMHTKIDVPLAQAVEMATVVPAKALGIFDEVGSIEVGKRADIIALDRDFNLQFVMVDGVVKIDV